MLELEALRKEDMFQLWKERIRARPHLRTPRLMPFEDQEKFYEDVVCNRNSNHYYYAVVDEGQVVGVTGLTFIDWINSRAEISLLIYEKHQKKGYGRQAVKLIIDEGFNNLGLNSIYGECYYIGDTHKFWENFLRHLNPDNYTVCYSIIRTTKYWDGKFHDSLHFTIRRKQCSELSSESSCRCHQSEA